MANYVAIDNLTNKGKIGISYLAFEKLVSDAISSIDGITKSSKQLKKNQKFRLNRPVKITIKNGVVHVWVAIEVALNVNEKEVISALEKEIHVALDSITEQVPFDVQIKVEKPNVDTKKK